MLQNLNIPVDFQITNAKPEELPLESRLAFVQVGIWELRRRWLAGDTADLDRLLACLDEDVSLLRHALVNTEEKAQAVSATP